MIDEAALRRAETAMRGYAERSRRRTEVGAYAVFLAPDREHRFLNLAVPYERPEALRGDAITAMLRAFADAGAAPKLEYMAELHPGLTEALTGAGLRLDSAAPVMTLALRELAPGVAAPGEPRLLRPDDDALLDAFLEGQGHAFAMPTAIGRALRPTMRNGMRDGDLIALAWCRDGRPVAGATLLCGGVSAGRGGAVAELAGVWTRQDLRRAGLGYAACHALLGVAAEGDTVEAWLSAAEGAEGLYRRLGFERVGTQHNVRR